MSALDRLLGHSRPLLTDGGLETWLFFQQGFSAPEFAAICLNDDHKALAAMERYFDEFLELAERADTGFVLDTNTWRGCTRWASALGKSEAELLEMNRQSVRFAKAMRAKWEGRIAPILVNGVVGPSGDGYSPQSTPSAEEAEAIHEPQIAVLAEEGVDMLSAITMTNVDEAIGVVHAAIRHGLPVVISFTVETDGKLPSGDTLNEAIAKVDAATGAAPAYFMVNCAHPEHFRPAIATGESWIKRIGGLRANASRLSHAELDEAEELDEGNPAEFGQLHGELAGLLPGLKVVGGCCGTDMRHVACVSEHLHEVAAA